MAKKLYTPKKIGAVEIRNRIVMSPMVDGFGEGGAPTKRSIAYFETRAKGGAGLIVVGNVHVDPTHVHLHPEFYLHDDKYVDGLKPLTQAIHAHGAKTFAQLIHQGRYARTDEYEGGVEAVAPSAIETGLTRQTPRALTIDEIKTLEEYFALAAKRAIDAGFDGIELCTNSGYLFGQFLSPLTNQREDAYGGDFDNRIRFLEETIAAVRAKIGADTPLTVRIGGNDFVKGGNDNHDACEIAKRLEQAGVDAISVTGGWHETGVPQVTMDLPNGAFSYLGKNIKRGVSIPVIMSNRMNIAVAEGLVERGDVDFVAFARPMLADPDFPNKAAAGRYDAIRPCIGCNQACLDCSMSNKSIGCLGNAECGHEAELADENGALPTQTKAAVSKKVLVIGAGAAGMECARVLALRSHQVTVWEKEETYGGQLQLAAAPPARHDFMKLRAFLYQACLDAGVQFVFGKNATAQDVLKVFEAKEADEVVIATGAHPAQAPFPIDEKADVVQAWDVLAKKSETGNEVVVIGGGAVGVETAILLAEEGTLSAEALRFLTLYGAETQETLRSALNSGSKKVTVVEMASKVGADIGKTTRWIMLGRLKQLGATVRTGARVEAITSDGVKIKTDDAEETLPAQTVVLAVGSKPENALHEALQGKIAPLHMIGDAGTCAKALDAVHAGYRLAISI